MEAVTQEIEQRKSKLTTLTQQQIKEIQEKKLNNKKSSKNGNYIQPIKGTRN
jgi:hypothetical protein